MTWSYSGDPTASDKDAVRYLCGDTCFDDQQSTDEEIAYAIAQESNVYFAAARVCRSISAMYARRPNQRIGDLSIDYKSITQQYDTLARELEARGTTRAATIYVGGISKTDKESVEETEDRVEPLFKTKIHDAPGSLYEVDAIDEV